MNGIPTGCLPENSIWLAGQGVHHQPLDCGVPIAWDFILPADPHARLQLADHIAVLLGKDGNQFVEILPVPKPLLHEWELLDRFRANLSDELTPSSSSPDRALKSGLPKKACATN